MEAFNYLLEAQLWVLHPALTEINPIVKADVIKANKAKKDESALTLTKQQKQKVQEWQDELKQNHKWESTRIKAIVAQVERARDQHPDVKILMFDQFAYFLDIVQIALENMAEPMKVLRFDHRASDTQRQSDLVEFKASKGPAVLLLSSVAGRQALDLTDAWYLVLCGNMWEASDHARCIKLAHREGQTRTVQVYKVQSSNCQVDKDEAQIQDFWKKNKKQIAASLEQELSLGDSQDEGEDID